MQGGQNLRSLLVETQIMRKNNHDATQRELCFCLHCLTDYHLSRREFLLVLLLSLGLSLRVSICPLVSTCREPLFVSHGSDCLSEECLCLRVSVCVSESLFVFQNLRLYLRVSVSVSESRFVSQSSRLCLRVSAGDCGGSRPCSGYVRVRRSGQTAGPTHR